MVGSLPAAAGSRPDRDRRRPERGPTFGAPAASSAQIEPPPGADLGQVDRRQLQHISSAHQQPCPGQHAGADLHRLGAQDLAILHQPGLGGGAAHVEGYYFPVAQPKCQCRAADHAGGGTALDDAGREGGGVVGGGEAAIGLHQCSGAVIPSVRSRAVSAVR